jgi:hypothetical protein
MSALAHESETALLEAHRQQARRFPLGVLAIGGDVVLMNRHLRQTLDAMIETFMRGVPLADEFCPHSNDIGEAATICAHRGGHTRGLPGRKTRSPSPAPRRPRRGRRRCCGPRRTDCRCRRCTMRRAEYRNNLLGEQLNAHIRSAGFRKAREVLMSETTDD